MNKHCFFSVAALAAFCGPSVFFEAEKGGGSGGAAAVSEPKTLAEAKTALSAAATKMSETEARATKAEAELAEAKAENGKLQGQFDAATQAATDANAARDKAISDLATAQATIATITGERDSAKAENVKAKGNIERLEKLCDVKGVDRSSAVDLVPEENAAGNVAALAQQWMDLKAAGKVQEAAEFRRKNAAALDAWAEAQ